MVISELYEGCYWLWMSYIRGYGGIGGRGLLMVMDELYKWLWGNRGSSVANCD